MATMITMLALACAAAIFFMIVRVIKGGVYGILTKTLASLFFIALGVAGIVTNLNTVSTSSIFILFGLVFGLVGDIILDLKVVYPESNDIYLTSGMISFGIGHILFFIALLLYTVFSLTTLLICVAIAIGLTAIVILSSKPLKINFGKFLIHSILYSFILIFMGAYSVALAIANPAMLLMAIGMVAFFLSDIVLSTMYFGGKPNDKFLVIVNHTLYYAAQICIAAFLFVI